MTTQEVPTLDLTDLSDHQRRLLTPESIEEVLTYPQLKSLGNALGLKTVGMEKDALQSALLFVAYQLEGEPVKENLVTLVAGRGFHDGSIRGGYGIGWREGERRQVPADVVKHLRESGGPGLFEVVNG